MSVADSAEAAAAVAAIRTMINGVMRDALPIAHEAAQHTVALTESFINDVGDTLGDIIAKTRVNLPGDGQDGPLDWSPVEDILNSTGDSLATVTGDIAKIIDSVQTNTNDLIMAIIPGAQEATAGLASALAQLVSGLLGSLTDEKDLWQAAYDIIKASYLLDSPAAKGWMNDTATMVLHTFSDILAKSINGYRIMGNAVMTGNETHALDPDSLAARMEAWPDWLKSLVSVALEFVSAWGILSALAAPKVSEVTQGALIENPIAPLSPPELASLLRRGAIGEGFAKDHAKRSGLSNQLFDLLMTLTRTFLTADNYVEMWRRTGDDSHLAMLRKLGIEDEDIDRLKIQALAIPTPTDLVRFMVRDVFDPSAVSTGQLDFEFSQKYDAEWARKTGVDPDTLKLYWMAHWSLPSPTMFYEMFHRGFIDEPQMRNALALADYAPGWIQHLIDINYNVPGRIDVRRMWEAGIITDHAELVKRHTDMGYSPADAETLAKFVETITARTKAREAEQERAPLVRAVIEEYGKGVLAYDVAHADLVELGLDDEHATYRLQQGIFEREQDRGQRIRVSIGREYVAGFLTESDARSRLEGYGFEANEQDSLLDSWNLDRELRELSEEKRHQRDLTKSEVVQSYADGILDPADTAAHLTAMGYDGAEAATLIHLEDSKLARRDAAATEAAVRTEYVRRAIDETGARDRLTAAGFSQRRINDRLTQWTIQREEARPDISTSQLERMLMLGVVPQDTLADILASRGYTEQDASLLLTLWGTEMAVNQATIDERRREFDVRESRLNAAQQATRERFEAQQRQQERLQTARLQASQAARAGQQAFTTARDATAFERRLQQQHDQQSAANTQLEKRLAATADLAARRLAQQRDLEAQHERARVAAQAAQDARQARALQAQADRLQTQIQARAAQAQAAAESRVALEAVRQAGAERLTGIRAQLTEARDVRLNSQRIATEQRQEGARVRQENRTAAQREATAAQAAADKERLRALQLQRDQAVAELNARLAALEVTAANQRAADALAQRQEAQARIARNTPTSALVDVNI